MKAPRHPNPMPKPILDKAKEPGRFVAVRVFGHLLDDRLTEQAKQNRR